MLNVTINILNNIVIAARTVSITVKCDFVFNSVLYLIEYEAVIRASSVSSNPRQEGCES